MNEEKNETSYEVSNIVIFEIISTQSSSVYYAEILHEWRKNMLIPNIFQK